MENRDVPPLVAHSAFEEDWAHAPPHGSTYPRSPHFLDEHLRAVGSLAESFAPFSAAELCRLAGLWHDLGKRRPGFQKYIRAAGGSDAHIERIQDHRKTHSAAGALWAERHLAKTFGARGQLASRVLQYVIAGHHAGLDDWEGGLAKRLSSPEALEELEESIARDWHADLLSGGNPDIDLGATPIQRDERDTPGRFALWTRMIFSALVDADFLDTETYMDPERSRHRASASKSDLTLLRDALTAHLDQLAQRAAESPVNRARTSVLLECRQKAALAPGTFSLTVPTGGGKTLSSLAFALEHGARHGKRRVIYAIPYTSIIEQTADVFRSAFAGLPDDPVLEHHSNAECDPENETPRSRLASENWDAPLIVTTNVQFFESLFARRTSRCRKLHNIANSVVVLDEAQLLPVEYLQPIVDILRYLVQDHGVTVLLCTATQPGLSGGGDSAPGRGLRRGLGTVTEIIDDVPRLYEALARVRVQLPASLDTPRDWSDIADEISRHPASMSIVSRRADAATLYALVRERAGGGTGCWHLSGLMCPQHRSDTIASIKAGLNARRLALARGTEPPPVRVVSTQLVEAGVDLDFPVVYRALAGLDSVAQAAGRCNREGKLQGLGTVHVFVPPTEPPRGLLRQARDHCRLVWRDRPDNPLALPLIAEYFRRLYGDAPSTDRKAICEMLRLELDSATRALSVQFRRASDAFQLIDDQEGATVIVRYRSPSSKEDVNSLIGLLQRDGPSRWLMRKLQRYGVTIYRHQIGRLLAAGDIQEIATMPGLFVQTEDWDGFYDPVLGARVDSAPGDPAGYFT